MRSHKTRSTRDRSIPRSLLRWVSTKSSISHLIFFFLDTTSCWRVPVSGIREKGNDSFQESTKYDQVDNNKEYTTVSPNCSKGPGSATKISARLRGRNEVSQAVRSSVPTPYKSMSRRARQTKTSIRHFLHNKPIPVRASRYRPTLATQRCNTSPSK